MSDQFGPKRPLGVTIVAALSILAGVVDVIGGIVLLSMQGDPEVVDRAGGAGLLVTAAIVSILFGAFMILIAFGLLRGNSASRIAATVVQAVSLAGSLWIGLTQPSALPTEIVSALIALALLFLLWSGEAGRYFKGLAPDEPTA